MLGLGLGLATAGGLLSAFGSNKAAKAQAQAYAAEQERQQRYLGQQVGAYDTLLPSLGQAAFMSRAGAAEQDAMGRYRGAVSGAPTPPMGFLQNAPSRVAAAFAPGGAGIPGADAQMQQAARERGLAEALLGRREELADASRKAALYRTLAARSQSAFAPEMQQAAGQGAATRGIGDILSAFGAFGTYGGLRGF